MKFPEEVLRFLMNTEESHGLVWSKTLLSDWLTETKKSLGENFLSFAVKGMPWTDGLQVIAPHLDAVDVSNLNEVELVEPYLKQSAELWLTNCPLDDVAKIQNKFKRPIWWNVGTPLELSAALATNLSIALRINTTSLMSESDPAYGKSRFGFDLSQVKSLSEADRLRVKALHCHHGGEKSTDDTFSYLLKQMVMLQKYFPNIDIINLGGGWANCSVDIWKRMAQEVPPYLKLVVEPGRAVTQSAGFAFGRVENVQKRGSRTFIEGELSPGAHLRWVRANQWRLLPLGDGERVLGEGEFWWGSRTCWEDDILPLSFNGMSVVAGDIIVWSRVAGYAIAWNHSFNGIPKAPVFLV